MVPFTFKLEYVREEVPIEESHVWLSEEGRAEGLEATAPSRGVATPKVGRYCVFWLDLKGRISRWSEQAEGVFGFVPDSGTSFRELFTEGDRERGTPGAILDAARDQGAWDGTGWRRRGNGDPFWSALSVTLIETPNGLQVGYMVVARDLSPMRTESPPPEIGEEATRLLALGRVASDVSHDVRNILTAIRGFAGLLERHLTGGSTSAMVWYELLKACDRGTTLTHKVLSVGRAADVECWETDLGRVVTEMEPLLRQLLPERIRLDVSVQGDVPPARARASEIELVLLNLVVNARDAIDGPGSIRLRVEGRGQRVRLSVTDSGSGMSPELVDRVFQRTFTTKGSEEGTGLGLALVHSAVREAGGVIAVDSTPGEGTSIALDLYAVRPVAACPAVSTSSQVAGTVLVCSVPAMGQGITEVLRRSGYLVATATTPEELALALRSLGDIRAVVVDFALGSAVVAPLVGLLEAEARQIPVVGISGPLPASDFPHRPDWTLLRGVVSPDALIERIDGLTDATESAAAVH